MSKYVVRVYCDRQGVEVEEVVQWQQTCDYVRHDYRNNGWGGSEPLKGCSLKATWAFKEAPYGTARLLRTTMHLCTRHFNRPESEWNASRTSEPYRITREVSQARAKRAVFAIAEEQHSGQCGTKHDPCLSEANSFEAKEVTQ